MKRRSVRMSTKASRGSSGSVLQEKKVIPDRIPDGRRESREGSLHSAVELEEAWTTTEEEQE